MRVVYITEQGSSIVKKGRQLLVIKDSKIIRRILTHQLQQIVLFGNINITTPAMKFLLREGIETLFLTITGKYLGRLVSSTGKNIKLKAKQFKLCENEAFKIKTAKEIVACKLKNQIEHLRRWQLQLSSDKLRKTVDDMKNLLLNLKTMTGLEQVRGIEGRASALYFASFGEILKGSELKFKGRSYHPPADEFNAVLSFLYTLLFNTVENFVLRHSLEPMLGVFHTAEYGKPSLVLDLMEEWRPIVCDYTAIKLVKSGKIKKSDFYYPEKEKPPFPELLEDFKNVPVIMRKDLIKKLVVAFENRLKYKLTVKNSAFPVKDLIERQVLTFARAIEMGRDYKGFLWR